MASDRPPDNGAPEPPLEHEPPGPSGEKPYNTVPSLPVSPVGARRQPYSAPADPSGPAGPWDKLVASAPRRKPQATPANQESGRKPRPPPKRRAVPPDRLVASGPARTKVRPRPRRESATRGGKWSGLLIGLMVVTIMLVGGGAGLAAWHLFNRPPATGFAVADDEVLTGDMVFGSSAAGDGAVQYLHDIAALGATAVAVGTESTGRRPRPLFAISTDSGRSWRMADVRGRDSGLPLVTSVNHVVAGQRGWLALGESVWTSPDARRWTEAGPVRGFRDGDQVRDVIDTGTGYVAVGSGGRASRGTAWSSADGRDWKRAEVDGVTRLNTVAARGDALFALGENAGRPVVLHSRANTWRQVRLPPVAGAEPEIGGGFASAGNEIVLVVPRTRGPGVRTEAGAYCSADGSSYSECGTAVPPGAEPFAVHDVAGSPAGIAVLVGIGPHFATYGRNQSGGWSRTHEVGQTGGGTLRAMAMTADGALIAAGDERTHDGNTPWLWSSSANRVTVPGMVRPWREVRRIATAEDSFVAVGVANGDGGIWTSSDGSGWKLGVDRDRAYTGDGGQELNDVARGDQGWLAVGRAQGTGQSALPLFLSSANAAEWRRAQVSGAGFAHSAAAGRSGYVAAGLTESGAPILWHSPNLREFAPGRLPATPGVRIHDVTAGTAGGFVAVGGMGTAERESAVVWISADGRRWAEAPKIAPSGAQSAGLRRIVAHGPVLAALGTGHRDGSVVPFSAVSSDNGQTWTTYWLPAGEIADLARADDGLIAVGSVGGPSKADSAVWTSADGKVWQRRTHSGTGLTGDGSQQINAVAVLGDRVVGVGASVTYQSERVVLWLATLQR